MVRDRPFLIRLSSHLADDIRLIRRVRYVSFKNGLIIRLSSNLADDKKYIQKLLNDIHI